MRKKRRKIPLPNDRAEAAPIVERPATPAEPGPYSFRDGRSGGMETELARINYRLIANPDRFRND